MYDAMRYTSKWAAFYFIVVMTIGNYILFNLLVAILVEGFSNDPVSKDTSQHIHSAVPSQRNLWSASNNTQVFLEKFYIFSMLTILFMLITKAEIYNVSIQVLPLD